MLGNGARQEPQPLPDRQLWQRSRTVDMVEDEAERFLDLAGFADGRLDPDERDRVAEWLDADLVAAADVAAAAALAAAAEPPPAAPPAIIARASALVGSGQMGSGNVIPLRRSAPTLRDLAHWGGLAAAMVLAGWLGFNLGMDTSRTVVQIGQPGTDGLLQELLDPSTALMRDFNDGAPT